MIVWNTLPKSGEWGETLNRTRQELIVNKHSFVVLSFTPKTPSSVLDDKIIHTAMSEEQLRPVSREEFHLLHRGLLGGKFCAETSLVAFGNTVRGPSDSGAFPGVPYLSITGEIEVAENWTRGSTGDQWDWEERFVFSPASTQIADSSNALT